MLDSFDTSQEGTLMIHRYSNRRSLACAVTLSCDGLIGQGTLVNLSVPGCRLETTLKLKVGQFVQIRLAFSSAHPPLWIALAAVRWAGGGHAGIEFIRMSEEDQATLRRYVGILEHHLPVRRTWSEKVMWTGISGV